MVLDAESIALIGGLPPGEEPLSHEGSGRDLAIVGGAHEGASRFDNSLALWAPALNSADMDILPDKALADARVRDMVRNDAYVQSGQMLHRDGIVGSMFMLNAKPETTTLGLDETWAAEFQEEVEAKFTLWAESPNNWPDAARTNTLTAMVRLAVGVYAAGGEVLATAEWLRDEPRPYQTAIQMIELERLATPPEYGGRLDRNIRGGIEFNNYGAPKQYHIRYQHPTDYDQGPEGWKYRAIPVRKPWGRLQVIHIHEQMRVDQSRGISDMVAALKEMKITKKFRDITLQNAVVNATYAASIESDMPPESAFQSIGGGNIGSAVTDYATAWLAAIAEYTGNAKNMHIDGVKIPHLFPGTKLQLRPAGTPGGVGSTFEASLLRYIAANLGVSYEELSRDYSQSNYSSLKAAVRQTETFMSSRKRMVADRFASAVYRLWLEEAMNKGEITSMLKTGPSWYDGMNADAYSACAWIGAGRGQIDELKETQAAVLRLKYHLSTYEEEMGKLGKDWRRSFGQSEREKMAMEKHGIVVEESNAVNALGGSDGEADSTRGGDDGSKTRKAA